MLKIIKIVEVEPVEVKNNRKFFNIDLSKPFKKEDK